jgi:hypothetical protein
VIVFKISNDNVKVIVKTKKNELETLIRNEHVLNQLLDTAPHDMQYIFDGEIVTKDLDDALKKCSTKKIQLHIKDRVLSILQYQYPNDDSCSVLLTTQKNANNSNNEELPDDYKQHFILEDFSDMVKSTMAKKLRLRVAHSYPLDITYKIMKFSTIQIYLCECIP